MPEDSLLDGGTYRGYRVSLRLVREGRRRYRLRTVSGPKDVYGFFSDLTKLDREVFCTVHLDGRNQIISCEEVSRGTLTTSPVHPREVYKGAILSSTASIIVAHNHRRPHALEAGSRRDLAALCRRRPAGDPADGQHRHRRRDLPEHPEA